MEARDTIISLEAQRDQLRQNGGSEADIARLTHEIDDRRTALRVAEREFAKLPNEPINPEDDWTRELNLGQGQGAGTGSPFASRTQMTSNELISVFSQLTGKTPREVNTVKIHFKANGENVHVPLERHDGFNSTGMGVGTRGYVEWRADDGTRIRDLAIDNTDDLRITYKDSEGTHSVRVSDLNKKKRR